METINDIILDAVLRNDLLKMLQLVIENDIKYEANLLIRVDLPNSTDLATKKELRGFYVRLDIRNEETVAKIVADLRRNRCPVERLAIITEDGEESHLPLDHVSF